MRSLSVVIEGSEDYLWNLGILKLCIVTSTTHLKRVMNCLSLYMYNTRTHATEAGINIRIIY